MRRALVCASIVGAGVACHSHAGPPRVSDAIAATFVGGRVTLRGSSLGAPGPDSRIVLDTRSIASTDPAVTTWTASRVVFVLGTADGPGHVALHTPHGDTPPIPLELYSLRRFDVPVTAQTNDGPLALALDAGAAHALLDEEYQREEIKAMSTISGAWTVVPIPSPPDPGPFATKTYCGDCRTQISELGESAVVDTAGRVWISQGGGLLYTAGFPNHSRIVRWDPPTGGLRVYDLPGDHNEVTGLAWDAPAHRLWYAQAGLDAGATLGFFDPEAVAYHDGTFDFSSPVVWGPPGAQSFPLPATDEYPAQLAIDDAGKVWYSAYLKGSLGRLDPATGAVDTFPLPPPRSASPNALSAGPWTIVVRPDGVLFVEQFDLQIGRLDRARAESGDPACRALASARNRCIRYLDVPDADTTNELAGELASAADGRLWYTVGMTPASASTSSGGTIGFVTPDFSAIERFPPIPTGTSGAGAWPTGIAIDPTDGDVWVADYLRRVYRLHRL